MESTRATFACEESTSNGKESGRYIATTIWSGVHCCLISGDTDGLDFGSCNALGNLAYAIFKREFFVFGFPFERRPLVLDSRDAVYGYMTLKWRKPSTTLSLSTN